MIAVVDLGYFFLNLSKISASRHAGFRRQASVSQPRMHHSPGHSNRDQYPVPRGLKRCFHLQQTQARRSRPDPPGPSASMGSGQFLSLQIHPEETSDRPQSPLQHPLISLGTVACSTDTSVQDWDQSDRSIHHGNDPLKQSLYQSSGKPTSQDSAAKGLTPPGEPASCQPFDVTRLRCCRLRPASLPGAERDKTTSCSQTTSPHSPSYPTNVVM
jgi:hypothetical protein